MELLEGVLSLDVADCAVVDQGDVVSEFVEMSVDTVVAEVHHTVFEPSVEWRVVFVENILGELYPVDGLGLFFPESESSLGIHGGVESLLVFIGFSLFGFFFFHCV